MLMIRLQRTGRTNDPSFRIVALEKASGPKSGSYTDLLGTYNPKTKALTIAGDRVKDWVSKGAQLSPSVSNLLISKGIIEGKKQNVLPKKTPIKKEGEEAAAAAPAAAAPAAAAPAETPAAEAAPEAAPAEPAPEAAPAEEAPAPVEAAA